MIKRGLFCTKTCTVPCGVARVLLGDHEFMFQNELKNKVAFPALTNNLNMLMAAQMLRIYCTQNICCILLATYVRSNFIYTGNCYMKRKLL